MIGKLKWGTQKTTLPFKSILSSFFLRIILSMIITLNDCYQFTHMTQIY